MYVDSIVGARVATEEVLKAIRAAQNLPDDAPWQMYATAVAVAAQSAWELTDTRYGQWRRDLAGNLLSWGTPQATVASLVGVSSSRVREWTQQPAEIPSVGEFRSESVGRARELQARQFLSGPLEELKREVEALHASAKHIAKDPRPAEFSALALLSHMSRTPALERLISWMIGALHIGGMSANSIGSFLGMSGKTVRGRAHWLAEYYRDGIALTD